LVKGVPITEFCDQNQLTPRQRLELFIPVCQAGGASKMMSPS
jgi:eukaryotic-like serine/threonine-protein kinase